MNKKLCVLAVSITLCTTTFAAKDEWIQISSRESVSKEKDFKVLYKNELKKDKFEKMNFDRPFLITTRYSNTNSGTYSKLLNTETINTNVVDCKNLRYATASRISSSYRISDVKDKEIVYKPVIEKQQFFDVSKYIPALHWKRIPKDSFVFEATCAKTKGFNPNMQFANTELSRWHLFAST